LVGIVGLAVLAGALFAATLIAVRYNVLRQPPSATTLIWPTLNLAALGWAIYGYTLFASALDHVRWRPASIASVVTLGGYIAFFVSVAPVVQDMWWRPWLERISIFKAYNPVELFNSPDTFSSHVSILATVAVLGIALAFGVFALRDLPANA
jgi:ABC-2 type transport system permease protein